MSVDCTAMPNWLIVRIALVDSMFLVHSYHMYLMIQRVSHVQYCGMVVSIVLALHHRPYNTRACPPVRLGQAMTTVFSLSVFSISSKHFDLTNFEKIKILLR